MTSLHPQSVFALKLASAQQPPPQGVMGSISSAGTFAPVFDADKRPITAGGTVDRSKGTVVFENATEAAGLSSWRHVMGTLVKKCTLETDGSGVGLIDAVGGYMNNGLVDLLVTDFSDYKALDHNDGAASFTDVVDSANIAQIAIPFVGWAMDFSTTTTTAGRI
jgi:hypothetical protein